MIGEWLALPTGFIIATLVTLVGFGGGILWMPYLLLVAGLEPSQAVTTSLMIQVGGMGSGSVAVIRAKKADLRLAFYLSASALFGIPVGVWLSKVIPSGSILFLLGVISLVMALVFVYTHEESTSAATGQIDLRRTMPYLGLSTVFAVLTGLLSMGVGDFLVPILRNRLRLSMETAMGSCLIVMAVSAAFAAALHLVIGDLFALRVVLWAIPGVILGGQIGPRLAGRIPDQTLKEIFIFALSLAGIHMMFNVQGM
jgi:uncharacterized protein